jgi:hypothetical protein
MESLALAQKGRRAWQNTMPTRRDIFQILYFKIYGGDEK